MDWLLGLLILILIGFCIYSYRCILRITKLKKLLDDAFISCEEKDVVIKNISSAKKSSEVKVGNITEQFAPFLDNWGYDPNNFSFLGKPIDGISYEEDEIIFIEIKSGKSRLSQKQNNIKKLVEEGKVSFRTFRVDEKGGRFV